MIKINPLNIIKMLSEDIQIKYSEETSINYREIDIKNHLIGIY
jgi:hypothetical protein